MKQNKPNKKVINKNSILPLPMLELIQLNYFIVLATAKWLLQLDVMFITDRALSKWPKINVFFWAKMKIDQVLIWFCHVQTFFSFWFKLVIRNNFFSFLKIALRKNVLGHTDNIAVLQSTVVLCVVLLTFTYTIGMTGSLDFEVWSPYILS